MRAGFAFVAALLATPASFAAGPAVERASVATADGLRSYIVARPSRRAPDPWPLVIVLHGHGGSAEQAFGWKERGSAVAIDEAAATWRRIDRISEPPATAPIPHLGGADDPTRAVRTIWSARGGSLQVELVRIEGGGHIEPSLSQRYGRLYQRLVGRQNHDLESAEEAWRFFKEKRAVVPNR